MTNVSVIILTFNEEANLSAALDSIKGWATEVFIVDSYSTDKTLEIAKKYTDKVYQHSFEDYGKQRNWAQDNLPIKNEWVFHLDADERVTPELAGEIKKALGKVSDEVNGFLIKKRTIFLGRWIRHGGHYPVYHLRLFRKGMGRCEDRRYDQHFMCDGKVLKLQYDIMEETKIDLTEWINRHNRWSSAEIEEAMIGHAQQGKVKERLFGSPIERRRWLKNRIFIRSPLFIRTFFYFIYRYFFRLGFLDGKEGLIFHFLQGLWFRFLVDAKIYEYRRQNELEK